MRRRLLGALVGCTVVAAAACGGPDPAGPPEQVDVSAPVEATGAARSTTVVAVGDIACAPDQRVTPRTCQQQATAELATSLDPDAVIALGDLQYEKGSISDFMGSYDDSWGELRSVTRPLPGNHEYNTDDAEGYFAYVDQSEPWYAWDAGTWRVYMLNSNCKDVDCDAEREWLKADLAEHPHTCSAIATHHPRYSSGKHHSDESMTGFWQTAYDGHVDLALSGHDHHYERFEPMDASGALDPGRGITSFVSGAGGKSLYAERDDEPGSAYFQNTAFGVLELELGARDFSWTFTDVDGNVLDTGSAPCV